MNDTKRQRIIKAIACVAIVLGYTTGVAAASIGLYSHTSQPEESATVLNWSSRGMNPCLKSQFGKSISFFFSVLP